MNGMNSGKKKAWLGESCVGQRNQANGILNGQSRWMERKRKRGKGIKRKRLLGADENIIRK